jgi:hypothetical protein
MELILPYYDERVAKQVFIERDLLLQVVEGLDEDLSNLTTRCAQAKSSEPLVEEMRNLRVRGLRLFRFLYISRRLLRVAHRRLKTEARMDGLDGEIHVLKSELSMSDGDEVLSLVNRVLKKPPKTVSRREERLALFRTVRLIATSRLREFSFGRVGRSYAASMRQLIRASTKRILNEQFIVLGEVIWRIVQPTLLPPRPHRHEPRRVVSVRFFLGRFFRAGSLTAQIPEIRQPKAGVRGSCLSAHQPASDWWAFLSLKLLPGC